jgi:DsbC/DsbD-like thiol-disulfide interchange protein
VKLALTILARIVLVLVLVALPSAQPQVPEAQDVVSSTTYASFDPASRGASFQLAVVLKIREGFHVNAHQASASYLIPTAITLDLPAGFKAGEVAYPKGELHTFSFTKTPLNVYQGKVVLRVPLTTAADAPTGAQRIPMKLRYQACNNELCLPPVKVDLQAIVNITPNSTAAHPAHPELFPAH